jgi:hypothetical protein
MKKFGSTKNISFAILVIIFFLFLFYKIISISPEKQEDWTKHEYREPWPTALTLDTNSNLTISAATSENKDNIKMELGSIRERARNAKDSRDIGHLTKLAEEVVTRLKPGDILYLDDLYYIQEGLLSIECTDRLRIEKRNSTTDRTIYHIGIDIPKIATYTHAHITTETRSGKIDSMDIKDTGSWSDK